MTECNEILIVMDTVTTKKTNTIAANKTNVLNTASVKCYYFNDIINLEDFDLDNILIDEKSHKNILIYDILYKTLFDPKPLRIRFDKVDGFIRIYDGIRYLILFGTEKNEAFYDRIRYIISIKSGITYIFLTIFQTLKLILMILYL